MSGRGGPWNWLVLAVLAAVLLVGLLLGRLSASPAGGTLAGYGVLAVGLLAMALMVVGAWMTGREQGRAERPLPYGDGEELKAGGEPVQPVIAAEERLEESPLWSTVQPIPEQSVEREPELILGGKRLAVLRQGDRWLIRARRLLGYDSIQVGFSIDREWGARFASASGRRQAGAGAAAWLRREGSLPLVLFAGSMLVYAVTRLLALDQFPINFFADEANQVLNGVELVRRGFRDPQGNLFPVYIQLFSFWYPDITVYLHAVTGTLFGVSIDVARATTAILSIPLAALLALLMRRIFDARYWWSVVLLLAATPVWLLWSRTAFDPAAMACLYGIFIVVYLLYRYRSPAFLYPALVVGAATFYAYPSAQPAMGVLAALLLVSDFRYHLAHLRTWRWALLLVLILAVPFVRFYGQHPEEMTSHLHAVNSYLLLDIPLGDKLLRGLSTYLEILSPAYWFLPDQPDLIRHELKGYGFLPLIELPLLLIGVVLCIRHFGESKYRAVLASLLAAPVGAVVADPAIIRELGFIAPATIASALGLEWILARVRGARAATFSALAVFAVLALAGLGLFQDALVNGPTWYKDYTLYGMQWGAKQLFTETIPQLAAENPGAPIYVSDTWANGTDVFLRFFKVDTTQVQMRNVNAWLVKKLPLEPNAIFVMTYDEYEKAQASPKFKNVQAQATIKYPDGRDGFYITRLEYADNVDQVFAAEREALRQLVTEKVMVDGQEVELSHTKFDIGSADSMFDNDPYTVARGVEANPLVLDFKFPQPRLLQGLDLWLGRSNSRVMVQLYTSDTAQPVTYTSDFANGSISLDNPAGPRSAMSFQPVTVTRARIEISYPESDDTAHVHVFELKFH